MVVRLRPGLAGESGFWVEMKKTVYCLRIRHSDADGWSETEYYRTRADRDHIERLNRCLGGIRTHSFQEKKTQEEISDLFDASI